MAQAHCLKSMSDAQQDGMKFTTPACTMVRQALEVVPALTFGVPKLENAQALLCLAMVINGTMTPEPTTMLVAAAVRTLQAIGAHRIESASLDKDEDAMELQRISWTAYCLDIDIALRTEQPPIMCDGDIITPQIQMWSHDDMGVVRSLDHCFEVNLFDCRVELARIERQIWSEMCSAKTYHQPEEREKMRRKLSAGLASWRGSLCFVFKVQELIGRWSKVAIVHIVSIHFRYLQLLQVLDQDPSESGKEVLSAADRTNIRSRHLRYSTTPAVVESARDGLELAALVPRGNSGCALLSIDISVSAMITLLANTISHPLHTLVEYDLRTVEAWIRFLDRLAILSERRDIRENHDFLSQLYDRTVANVSEAHMAEYWADPLLEEIRDGDAAAIPTSQSQEEETEDLIWLPELEKMFDDETSSLMDVVHDNGGLTLRRWEN